MDSRELLKRLNERTSRTFESESRVVSFREYFEEFTADPRRYGRIAASYIADCFDHWGTEQVQRVGGMVTRWKLFDAPFEEGREPLVGQEEVQREFYQALRAFSREGRADKLIFLHGPNGSAKTTFCELIFRALECYSRVPEGALHRFSWVFPTREAQGKRLGFTEFGVHSMLTGRTKPPIDRLRKIATELGLKGTDADQFVIDGQLPHCPRDIRNLVAELQRKVSALTIENGQLRSGAPGKG